MLSVVEQLWRAILSFTAFADWSWWGGCLHPFHSYRGSPHHAFPFVTIIICLTEMRRCIFDRLCSILLLPCADCFIAFMILELRYTFPCSSAGPSNYAIHSMQFRTIELRHTFQRSSVATRLNAAQDRRTLLYVPMQLRTLELSYMFQRGSGVSNLAVRFNAVQDQRTLLYFPMQIRTLELRYTFQCRSGLSDFAIGSTLPYCNSGLSTIATCFNAVRV